MKKILLYSPMFDFVVEDVIAKINDIPEDEEFIFEMNSPGGSVFAGWGLINALQERGDKVKVLVTGHSASMAFFVALLMDNVEALDVSSFMIHRAHGYAETDEQKELLNTVNGVLRAKMEKKIKPSLFKQITNTSIKSIFEDEERKDVWISAKQAKDLGLIKSIRRIEAQDHLDLVAMFEHSQGSEGTQGSESVEDQVDIDSFIKNFKL